MRYYDVNTVLNTTSNLYAMHNSSLERYLLEVDPLLLTANFTLKSTVLVQSDVTRVVSSDGVVVLQAGANL